MKRSVFIFPFGVALLLALASGCEQKKGAITDIANPFDTTTSAYVWPVTTLIEGPADNGTIHSPSVTFRWSGTEHVIRYEISMNSGAWASTTATTVTYDDLDEGTYTIAIRSIRDDNVVETNPPRRTFIVDAVTAENSVLFYPRKNRTTALNAVSTYAIRCENFKNVAGLQLTLQFDPAQIDITDAKNLNGSIFQKSGMSASVLLGTSGPGKNIINIVALPASKAIPFGVSGSDLLLTLSVKPKAKGQIPIAILATETIMRDSTNAVLKNGQMVNGLIEVQ
ncbi:MAG: cohesin domain-containing protein [Ignavibacteriales bacterium]|nr:cohesin domain-containing protein [Ignavibacteriales bacterium]